MSNLMLALGKLAYSRCAGEIEAVLRMWVGGLVAGVAFIILFGIHFLQSISEIPRPLPFDLVSIAFYYAFSWGVFYTGLFLTTLALIVIIFEFLLNFTIVMYYYDNCSWKSVEVINRFFTDMTTRFQKVREANRADARKDRFALKAEILKIQNSREKS